MGHFLFYSISRLNPWEPKRGWVSQRLDQKSKTEWCRSTARRDCCELCNTSWKRIAPSGSYNLGIEQFLLFDLRSCPARPVQACRETQDELRFRGVPVSVSVSELVRKHKTHSNAAFSASSMARLICLPISSSKPDQSL